MKLDHQTGFGFRALMARFSAVDLRFQSQCLFTARAAGSALLLAATVLLSFQVTVRAANHAATKDEYRVYDAAIAHVFADRITRSKVKHLVIREHTNTDYASDGNKENWQQVRIHLNSLSDATIAGYEVARPMRTELKRSFKLGVPYSLFTQKDYESIFGTTRNNNGTTEFWNRFYTKFPESGGYVWLSNVGYNKARDQALVYFVHWCGIACGTGDYIQLGKTGDRWKVEAVAPVWIS